jgi:hypothetical protein
MRDGKPAERCYVAAERPTAEQIAVRDPHAPDNGWMVCETPWEDSNVLYKGRITARSAWYSRGTDAMMENPQSITVFGLVAPYMRKMLRKFPWVVFLRQRAWDKAPCDGCSPGAEAWYRSGNCLMQRGVLNQRYVLDDPDVVSLDIDALAKNCQVP